MTRTPATVYAQGQQLDGFTVRRVTPLDELRCVAYELDHPATGARILHLHNDDAENLFSVTFPTPPPDDTGVPHILEHAVLGGSKKYAVKDPFFEMVKSSMATFINAMTGSDYTVYPVASNVKRDFYNLADVYWDAVFHPSLTEQTFQREGHHLEFATKGDLESDLIVKGIVYNEMKGARSSPDAKVFDLIEKSLWPDTPYGKDSGGDPDHIPDLTYEEFKSFHATFYHPTNGFIFLYGDIPTADHLKFLAPRLAEFERKPVDARIPAQPRWPSPRYLEGRYAVGPSDPIDGKTYVSMNWLVGDGADTADVLALSALERILLGNQGAPLRKALIESHLGEDLSHTGLWVNGRESSFHVGLKGSEPERTPAVEKLVFDTLRRVADAGVTQQQTDAAFQQLAYRYREIASMYPLHLMDRVAHPWMHGADPLSMLRAGTELEALQLRCAADPQLFSRLIRERLLDNAHRLTLTVTPDREIQAKKDAEFNAKMKKLKASLATDDLQEIAREQNEMDALLSAPNPPAALAALPQLKVSDLPPTPRRIPTTIEQTPGVELLKNDVFANGVNYLQLSFDLAALPPNLQPYLPMYADVVAKMGAAGLDYVAMAERVAAHTGGVAFSHAVNTRVDSPDAGLRRGTFSMKFLDDKVEPAMGVLHDFIFEPDPTDDGRLTDVLHQVRAHHRTRPATDGMGLALRHAARGFSPEGFLTETWHGVPQTHLVERLAAAPRSDLIEKLLAIRAFLRQSGRPTASFTGADTVYGKVRTLLTEWTARMTSPAPSSGQSRFERFASPPREGLAAPMNVAYCVTVFPAPHISSPAAPLLAVGSRLVSFGYVLEEVRFKGTAYGGGCGYGGHHSTWEFHSYRDPWIHRTLDVYARATDYVRAADWSKAEVDRAIIGTAKEFERPIRPAEATGQALWRHLAGDTSERREARHAALLRATPGEVKRAVLETFEAGFPNAAVCVVSSREKLEAANKERPGEALGIEDVLPSQGG